MFDEPFLMPCDTSAGATVKDNTDGKHFGYSLATGCPTPIETAIGEVHKIVFEASYSTECDNLVLYLKHYDTFAEQHCNIPLTDEFDPVTITGTS